MTHPPSGAGPSWDGAWRPSSAVLRLLPAVHHPPARVLVPGARAVRDAEALDARGYRVTLADRSPPTVHGVRTLAADLFDLDASEPWDLVCEQGYLPGLSPDLRPAWAAAVARLVRSGGKLFGALYAGDSAAGPPWPVSAGELTALLSGAFEVERLQPVPGSATTLEAVFSRR